MWGGKATCVGEEKYVYVGREGHVCGRGEECVGGLRRCSDMRREILYQIMNSIKQFSWAIIVVSLVAWFTLVLEANCIRQPVSLLFPPLLFILK